LALLIAPGLLAIATAGRILASPSLKDQAPWLVYVLTFCSMIFLYVIIITPGLLQPRSSEA
jgi:hypothetical protein